MSSFELKANGESELYLFDEEGAPFLGGSALERVVAERGLTYQVVFFGAVLVVGGMVGAWIANAFSAAFPLLPAALVTFVVLAALVALWVMAHRRGW